MLTGMIAAAAIAGALVTPHGVTVSHAGADWFSRTCSAATAFGHHQSAANLATLVTDSLHLPKSYTRADVGQVYADASSPSPKAAKYVVHDLAYLRQDCANPVLH